MLQLAVCSLLGAGDDAVASEESPHGLHCDDVGCLEHLHVLKRSVGGRRRVIGWRDVGNTALELTPRVALVPMSNTCLVLRSV